MTTGGVAIRRVRRWARLSQEELAARLDVLLPDLQAWESGVSEPGFSTVYKAAEVCGYRLADVLREADLDEHELSLLTTTVAMTMDQRFQSLLNYVRFVEAGRASLRQGRARNDC